MPSIRDVAQKAGVSPTTVSRTFRKPDLLNEETQNRVLAAARQLGYRPRVISPPSLTSTGAESRTVAPVQSRRQVANSSATGSLGFLFFANTAGEVVDSHIFYAPVLAGAQAEATARGLNLMIHTTDLSDPDAPLPRMVLEQSVGGLLLVGAVNRATVDRFAQHRQHVVLVDNLDIEETGTYEYETVVSDGFGGELAAVRYLIAQGHRRVGFIATRRGVPTFQDRLRGYWCALLEAGITPDPSYVFLPEPDDIILEPRLYYAGAFQRLRKRMSEPEPPTAIAAANDSCARLVQLELLKDGLHIPDDFSLIGFDDMPYAAEADPPLTTVHVDREGMGRLAVRRLALLMESSEASSEFPRVQFKMPVAVVERASCRPPRNV